ncbi:MAG: hypothetical protein SGARI_001960 [Bacillariaceae sp.]
MAGRAPIDTNTRSGEISDPNAEMWEHKVALRIPLLLPSGEWIDLPTLFDGRVFFLLPSGETMVAPGPEDALKVYATVANFNFCLFEIRQRSAVRTIVHNSGTEIGALVDDVLESLQDTREQGEVLISQGYRFLFINNMTRILVSLNNFRAPSARSYAHNFLIGVRATNSKVTAWQLAIIERAAMDAFNAEQSPLFDKVFRMKEEMEKDLAAHLQLFEFELQLLAGTFVQGTMASYVGHEDGRIHSKVPKPASYIRGSPSNIWRA